MIKKVSGIYKIKSVIKPERFYIGSSCSVFKRKNYHFEDLRLNKYRNTKLQNHYNKYGESDLVFTLLEECLEEELIIREQYYIDTQNPWFNICKIAGSPRGIKHSDKSKHNMSIAHIGKSVKLTEEGRKKKR